MGCAFNRALKPLGLRTPFWGPLSGLSSTIGGGLSQNNAFFGAGLYGPSVESVLSLTIALVRWHPPENRQCGRGEMPIPSSAPMART